MLSSYGNTAGQTPINTVIIPIVVGDECDRVCVNASFAFFLSLSVSVPIGQMGSKP